MVDVSVIAPFKPDTSPIEHRRKPMFKECPVRSIAVITSEQKRRRYTPEEKARLVALAMQSGYTILLVAR